MRRFFIGCLFLCMIIGTITGCQKEDMTTTEITKEKTYESQNGEKSLSERLNSVMYQCINGEQMDGIHSWKISENEGSYVIRIETDSLEDTAKENLETALNDEFSDINFQIDYQQSEQ